ncbi:MAG: hypothetical protein CMM02_19715 [Rhodopirellula sp.]|nr:hypothetical protein [Rhodopirellula sp.]|tara:strand:- start:27975 stop:32360 length:4386 start_codon:yes stop_codon:yes gene_type:complete
MSIIIDPFAPLPTGQRNYDWSPTATGYESKPDKGYDFGDLWKAHATYTYEPIWDWLSNTYDHWDRMDEDYNPFNDMEGYEKYYDDLAYAKNAEHMEDLKRQIDDGLERREIMGEFGFMANMFAGLISDPANLLPLPFALTRGVATGIARGSIRSATGVMARTGRNTALGVAGVTGIQEGMRYPTDILATPEEVAMNMGSAVVGGFLLGGLLGIPMARKWKAYETTVKDADVEVKLHKGNIDRANGVAPDKKEHRPMGHLTDDELVAANESLPKQIEKLKEIERTAPTLKEKKQIIKDLFKTTIRSINRLTDAEIVKKFGKEFNVKGVISAPAKKIEALQAQGKLPKKVLGRHFYGDITNKLQGIVYVNRDAIMFAFNRLQGWANDPTILAKAIKDGGASAQSKLHWKFQFNNRDAFKTVDDLTDFVFFHELYHGKVKKKKGESTLAYENRINVLALDRVMTEKKKIRVASKSAKEIGMTREQIDEAIIHKEGELAQIQTEVIDRRNDIQLANIDDPYKIADSWFTNSVIYKLIPTPLKSTLLSKRVPTAHKKRMVMLIGDNGTLLNLHKSGFTTGESVFTGAKRWQGEYMEVYDYALNQYALGTKKGNNMIMDWSGIKSPIGKGRLTDTRPSGFEEFFINANLRRLEGKKGNTNYERNVIKKMDDFWETWGTRLEEVGLIGSKRYFEKRKVEINRRLTIAQKQLDDIEKEVADTLGELTKAPKDAPSFKDVLTGATIKPKYATEELINIMIKRDRLRQILDDPETSGLTKGQHKALAKLDAMIKRMLAKDPLPPRLRNKLVFKKASVVRMKNEINNLDDQLKNIKDNPILPANEEKMFARYWNHDYVTANRAELEGILSDWYKTNNKLWVREHDDSGNSKWVEKELKTDDVSTRERAKNTVDNILGLVDETTEVNSYYGMGKSKHFKHRTLDIPNVLVKDFIQTDPVAVMKAYTDRVAPRYEFAKKFRDKNLEDVLDDIDDDIMIYGKGTKADADEARKNFIIGYDRVVGSVLRDSNTWDNRTAQVLRDMTQMTYLGSAGFSTLPDAAKIIFEHEIGTIFKTLSSVLDSRVRMNAYEGRIAGEILDIVNNSSHMRLTNELNNNPFARGTYQKVTGEAKSAFYMLNLLAPMTRTFKQIDSMCRVHTFVDLAVKRATTGLKQQDMEILSRYNIGAQEAKQIKELVDMNIIQKTEKGLYLLNSKKWPKEYHGLRNTFRGSLNSGILNTVLMGTPADLPVLVDGIFHIPMRIAGKFGMSEDPKVRGYARVESGLLGMPFQFMSYSFAAMNKITASMAQGQLRNTTVGVLASLGLGYLSLELKAQTSLIGSDKTKAWYWENLSAEDKMLRAFDQSGLLALISDIYYTAMENGERFGVDMGFGLFNPKVKSREDDTNWDKTMDTFTSIGGAGMSWGDAVARKGFGEILQGNYGEGSSQLLKNAPFLKLWFLRGFMGDMGSELRRSRW